MNITDQIQLLAHRRTKLSCLWANQSLSDVIDFALVELGNEKAGDPAPFAVHCRNILEGVFTFICRVGDIQFVVDSLDDFYKKALFLEMYVSSSNSSEDVVSALVSDYEFYKSLGVDGEWVGVAVRRRATMLLEDNMGTVFTEGELIALPESECPLAAKSILGSAKDRGQIK